MTDNAETCWVSVKDIKAIREFDHWKIQSIEGHQLQAPISPHFSFLCQWKNTAWKPSDEETDAFMKSQACTPRRAHNNNLT